MERLPPKTPKFLNLAELGFKETYDFSPVFRPVWSDHLIY